MSGYQPNWDIDRARGEEAEGLYRLLRTNLLSGRAEVKRDDRAHSTGNVYVEYECQRRDGWHPSGIATTGSDDWAFYIKPALIVVPTSTLLNVARAYWEDPRHRRDCIRGSHPTKGVTIPVSDLVPAIVECFHAERKVA